VSEHEWMEWAKLMASVVSPFLANLRHKKSLSTNGTTMNDQDVQKLITAMKEAFPSKLDHTELQETVNQIAEIVNANSAKLDNLASKHDLETMLEKSLSLGVLKAEHDLMKKYMREKLHVEI
jgi:acyl-CoA reductase-like NAD-dependent aldehyde dehydrogenase